MESLTRTGMREDQAVSEATVTPRSVGWYAVCSGFPRLLESGVCVLFDDVCG